MRNLLQQGMHFSKPPEPEENDEGEIVAFVREINWGICSVIP